VARRFDSLLIVLTALIFLFCEFPAFARSVREVDRVYLDDIATGRDGERRVELYLRVVTRYGEPVGGLTHSDFAINDAGERIDPDDLQVETLGETQAGMTVVLAIDNSRTMRGEPFEQARAAALEFVRLLDPRDRVAILTFSDDVDVLAKFPVSRARTIAILGNLEIAPRSLRTVLYDGLHKAIELIRLGEKLPRRAYIVVFSDGEDSGSHRTLGQIEDFGRSNPVQPPVLVFSIGYSRFGEDGLAILEKISVDTGGEFYRSERPQEMTGHFNSIRKQMTESLIVTYEGEVDGGEHQVEVTVGGATASRTARYKKIAVPILPWALTGLVLLLVALAGFFAARGRRTGRLIFSTGPLAGTGVTLGRPRTRIGALPENEIVLDAETISRFHAVIVFKGREMEIRDLGSRNGTFVNDLQIDQTPLGVGDRVRFADVEARVER
jgi:VWFA-related protein